MSADFQIFDFQLNRRSSHPGIFIYLIDHVDRLITHADDIVMMSQIETHGVKGDIALFDFQADVPFIHQLRIADYLQLTGQEHRPHIPGTVGFKEIKYCKQTLINLIKADFSVNLNFRNEVMIGQVNVGIIIDAPCEFRVDDMEIGVKE